MFTGIVAIIALVFRRVCCRRLPSSNSSDASDAEFGNDDASEKSSVVDFRLDPDLEDFSKYSKKKVEGWVNNGYANNKSDLSVCVSVTSSSGGNNVVTENNKTDDKNSKTSKKAKSLLSFILPSKK